MWRVFFTLIASAATAASSSSINVRETGAIAACTRSGWVTASCTENSLIGRRLCPPRLRGVPDGLAPLVEPDRERVQALQRFGLRLDHGAQVVGGFADRLFEQREQELVLAVEVLVEAAHRLLRPVDHLLDRELGRALLVDQLERGVEEALDPLLRTRARAVEAARDGSLPPIGFVGARRGGWFLPCSGLTFRDEHGTSGFGRDRTSYAATHTPL